MPTVSADCIAHISCLGLCLNQQKTLVALVSGIYAIITSEYKSPLIESNFEVFSASLDRNQLTTYTSNSLSIDDNNIYFII